MPPRLALDSPVRDIRRMHANTVAALDRMGVRTVRDLLLELPYDWESYGERVPIAALEDGRQALVTGTLESVRVKRAPRRGFDLTQATLRDDAGARLGVVWFRMPWIARDYRTGDRVTLAGKPAMTRYGLEMRNPLVERAAAGGQTLVRDMVPKYHLSGKIRSITVAELIAEVIDLADGLEDTIPEPVRGRRGLVSLAEAVRLGHQPESWEDWRRARARMAFAELFELQVAFVQIRRALETERAAPIAYRQEVIDAFKVGLGFEMTRAQRRSLWEVFQDIGREQPMNRLLNGDVGSGKTAVAAGAAAMAYAAGMQTVVMAPTEILARQHLQKFRAYLEPSFPGLRVDLLVSGLGAAERKRVRAAAASGADHCALLVGTHALIEDDVELQNLGLAIVDEQHRFGTRQRELLRAKGRGRPHFLAMTATPIPRTLALALYGEMTVSAIDEMPPGRTPVRTLVIDPDHRQAAYDLVRREVGAGHQAFVICPLIEENEKLQARAATAEYERLRTDVFPDLRVSLVHGKLRDKDAVMREFSAGASDVLVATAVVEVGVDVPNATVMLIEGAERFGLAQLHQFRGRVGRGSLESHCLLLEGEAGDRANQRLALVASTQDGFRIAEYDMRVRGVGELMGARQHGLSDQAMEALAQPQLLSEVRQEAEAVLEADPGLERSPGLRASVQARLARVSIS